MGEGEGREKGRAGVQGKERGERGSHSSNNSLDTLFYHYTHCYIFSS